VINKEGGKMMVEHNTLSSYLEELYGEKEALENVDIDALVEEKLTDMRARVKAEVLTVVETSKHDVDIRIETLTNAIGIVSRRVEVEDEDAVCEIINDETN
jgi:predicted membrane GTPase involved in stress response